MNAFQRDGKEVTLVPNNRKMQRGGKNKEDVRNKRVGERRRRLGKKGS